MFGKNAVAKVTWTRREGAAPTPQQQGAVLGVTAIFPTIQGEGPYAGEPAIFIRLQGCNLRCYFCDTEFESGKDMTVQEIVDECLALTHKDYVDRIATDLIVLTGGEPMRQQIIPLAMALDDAGFHIQVETAGTVWPESLETPTRVHDLEDLMDATRPHQGVVELVCSPKAPHVHPKVEKYCEHFKYIIRAGQVDPADGLPNESTQQLGTAARVWRPDLDNVFKHIWVQPCYEYNTSDSLASGPHEHWIKRNTDECVRSAMKFGYRLSIQQHKVVGID